MLTALSLALFAPDAHACGGFFCNNIDPVEQAGEHIVFEVDPDAGVSGQTTMHVQVEYEGPPTEFAWVVPVRGVPDMFVSSDLLFSTLQQQTRPRFWLDWDFGGECNLWDDMWAVDADASPPASPEEGGVSVLDEQKVGPYETVVVAAEDATVLVDWLQEHDYAVPDGLAPVLAPYLADGHNFVALRLASGQDSGDLTPLALRYDGLQPAIPIQLTSVAATPDMQLVAYVLGPARAIPQNYLHVELNPSAINWFDGGSNYMDVLARAADEAGGHAFSTEFAGETSAFDGAFWQPSWGQLELHESTGPTDFLQRIVFSGLPPSASLLEFLETYVPVPAGLDPVTVYNCPSCVPELDDQLADLDLLAAADAFDARILEPLQAIDAMFTRADHITRLGSTMSPAEMTVDPIFAFNPDLPQQVSNFHTATLAFDCEGDVEANVDDVPRTLTLPDGRVLELPSRSELAAMGLTDAQYLDTLVEPAASRIERMLTSGDAEVLWDGSAEIDQNVDDLNRRTRRMRRAGGCSSVPAGGAGLGGLALLGLALRRRR